MSEHFRCIGLIGKYEDPGIGAALRMLNEHLQRRHLRVLLDAGTARSVPDGSCVDCEVMERGALAESCDLAIVVGGDGTLLNAARSMADAGTPVLGVNLGRLGFLVDVWPDEMGVRLDEILAGNYLEEARSLLHAAIHRDGQRLDTSDALNDVVVHKWDIARMIELEISIDGRFLNAQRSDGLIVATPTGSTAYALSGGGPILHPTLNAVVLVPICPHTLSNRPIVINDYSSIEITVAGNVSRQAQVTCDGQVNFELRAGDRVVIHRKEHGLRLIHPAGHDYFEILRAKLRWGEQP